MAKFDPPSDLYGDEKRCGICDEPLEYDAWMRVWYCSRDHDAAPVDPEPLYRVHHIAEDEMQKKPTEYYSAPLTEVEADAKVAEIQAKNINAWKMAQA